MLLSAKHVSKSQHQGPQLSLFFWLMHLSIFTTFAMGISSVAEKLQYEIIMEKQIKYILHIKYILEHYHHLLVTVGWIWPLNFLQVHGGKTESGFPLIYYTHFSPVLNHSGLAVMNVLQHFHTLGLQEDLNSDWQNNLKS